MSLPLISATSAQRGYSDSQQPISYHQASSSSSSSSRATSSSPNPRWSLNIHDFIQKDDLVQARFTQTITLIQTQAEQTSLAEALGNHPVALTLANAYIKAQKIDNAAYIEEYKKAESRLRLSNKTDCPISVAATWLLTKEKIETKDPNAILLLKLCSYMSEDNIPERALEDWFVNNIKTAWYSHDSRHYIDAVTLLVSYGLVTRALVSHDSVRNYTISLSGDVHRLSRNVQPQTNFDVIKSMISGASCFNYFFQENGYLFPRIKDLKPFYKHAIAIFNHASQHGIVDEQVGLLGTLLSAHYLKMSELKEGHKCQRIALNIFEVCYKEKPVLDLAHAYSNFGNILVAQGDASRGIKYIKKALKINAAINSDSNTLENAGCYNDLGLALQAKGDFDRAIKYLKLALQIRKTWSGRDCNVAKSHMNIGNAYLAINKPDEAEPYFKIADEIYRIWHPEEDHLDNAHFYYSLGMLSKLRGYYEDARDQIETALSICIQCRDGDRHLDVAHCYKNLGAVFIDLGLFDEAKLNSEKAYSLLNSILGDTHSDLADCSKQLGDIYQGLHQYAEACASYRNAKKIHQILDGDTHNAFYDELIFNAFYEQQIHELKSTVVMAQPAMASEEI